MAGQDLPSALRAFDEALAADADRFDALYYRGVLRAQLGWRDEAISDLERARELAGSNAWRDSIDRALASARRPRD